MGKKKKKDNEGASCRVKVHIRLKQCSDKEKATYNIFADATQLHIPNSKGRLELDKWFYYDHIYSPISSNKEVYRLSTYDLVESTLRGINTALFAYGPTGSGKTHTLTSKDGVTAHAVSHLFNRIWRRTDQDYKVTCSYFQIYNERIFDLLNPKSSCECLIKDDIDGDVYVENMVNVQCETPMDVYELINVGRKTLCVAETKMNRLAHRSHVIFQLSIERTKRALLTRRSSMHETYSTADHILAGRNKEQNESSIDFETVPFNKANLRKRHSIAVEKANDKNNSASSSSSLKESMNNLPANLGRQRELYDVTKVNERNNSSEVPKSDDNTTLRTSSVSPAYTSPDNSTGDASHLELNVNEESLEDSMGVRSTRRLKDLYQSNGRINSESESDCIHFDTRNLFTFSEGCADDYESYYDEEENEQVVDVTQYINEGETDQYDIDDFALRKSKISIIDLAGSERLADPNVDYDRIKEAKNINLSLLELGNVISALSSSMKKHVPYRNSVLTQLLRDSLGGNCKTKFLLCISTNIADTNQAKCTLEFGQRLMKVYTKPLPNINIDYRRKYEYLLRVLKQKENDYVIMKKEFSTLLVAAKNEIQKKEDLICDHEISLNSMQAQVYIADIERQKFKKKVDEFQETVVDKNNKLKQKEDELLKLDMEINSLLEKLKTNALSNQTFVTYDATTNTSPSDFLQDDIVDGPAIETCDMATNTFHNTLYNEKPVSETFDASTNTAQIPITHPIIVSFSKQPNNPSTKYAKTCDVATNTIGNDRFDRNSVFDSSTTFSNTTNTSTANPIVVTFIRSSETESKIKNVVQNDTSSRPADRGGVAMTTMNNESIDKRSAIERRDVSTNTSGISVANPIVVTFIRPPRKESNITNMVEANMQKKKRIIKIPDQTTPRIPISKDRGAPFGISSDEYRINGNSEKQDKLKQYRDINMIKSAILAELYKLQSLFDHDNFLCEKSIAPTENTRSSMHGTEYIEPINDGIYGVITEIFGMLPNMLSECQQSNQSHEEGIEKSRVVRRKTMKSAPATSKYPSVKEQLEFLQDYLARRKQSIEKDLHSIVNEVTNNNEENLSSNSVPGIDLIKLLIQNLSDKSSTSFYDLEQLHNLFNIIVCEHTVTACLIASRTWQRYDKHLELIFHHSNIKPSSSSEENADVAKERKSFLNKILRIRPKSGVR